MSLATILLSHILVCSIMSVLLHVFLFCLPRCIYDYKFYVFLWTDPFIIIKCPSPVKIFSSKNFGLTISFVCISIAILAFIWVL